MLCIEIHIKQQMLLNIQKPVAVELSRFSKIDVKFIEEIIQIIRIEFEKKKKTLHILTENIHLLHCHHHHHSQPLLAFACQNVWWSKLKFHEKWVYFLFTFSLSLTLPNTFTFHSQNQKLNSLQKRAWRVVRSLSFCFPSHISHKIHDYFCFIQNWKMTKNV